MLLKELNLGQHKYEVTSLAVSLSLEGKASHRELTSRLLSDLSGKMLTQRDMAHAFDKMLKELPDLILDTPDAPQVEPKTKEPELWICTLCLLRRVERQIEALPPSKIKDMLGFYCRFQLDFTQSSDISVYMSTFDVRVSITT